MISPILRGYNINVLFVFSFVWYCKKDYLIDTDILSIMRHIKLNL